MIQKLQKIFHTDKWWGRTLFSFCFDFLFLLSGTLVYFLFSWVEYIKLPLPSGWFPLIYFYILLPLLSFIFLIKIFKKIDAGINKITLFFLNLMILLLMFFVFFLIVYFSISPNFF
jgi:hypothetical protein